MFSPQSWETVTKSKKIVADPILKPTSAVWMVEFFCATVSKSLKEAIIDSIWEQSAIAT